ncbi:MAG: DUF2336 domain-containing protein, partial [Geminicoccaceae bacterium]
MSGDARDAQSSAGAETVSGAAPPLDAPPLDAMAIELATGLSIADFETLGADPSPDARADIAVKFAREFDRLAKASPSKLADDLLGIFSKDRDKKVRSRFADSVKTSPFLPPKIAKRLATDVIAVAAPILERSPVLDNNLIGDIIRTLPESHALVIADRRPLAAALVDLLIERKGTKRVVVRLLDNDEAELSEPALLGLRDWGLSDPDIDERLRRRPNLPFSFVNQCVAELAAQVQWPSLGKRAMNKFEATLLQNRVEGMSGRPSSVRGERLHRQKRAFKEEFERGLLRPSSLLAFLRDGEIDRLECGFAVMSGLDLRQVRRLLRASDKRALIALCLKAGFSTADYLAFRIALGLAEIGSVREQTQQRYSEKTMQFARDQ